MSVPDPSPPRKLSRAGLYIPFLLMLAFVAAWSAAWWQAHREVARRLDSAAGDLRRAGYQVSWQARQIGGYPFRLDVTLIEPQIRDPSGWALRAPRLEGEAFLHAPTHWVIATPKGLTFVRPVDGPVEVTGKLMHASLTHLSDLPPSFSFEGVDLTFTPGAGGAPFALSRADRIEAHLRKAPAAVGDEAGAWLTVQGGRAQLPALLGRIAADKPVAVEWDGRLSKISAFHGATWADAVRAWTAAGGRMAVKRAGLTAGEALIGVTAGTLAVDSDGRLQGALDVSLRQAPRALDAMTQAGTITAQQSEAAATVIQADTTGDLARATVHFEAGRTTLGPVALGPAPRVYGSR